MELVPSITEFFHARKEAAPVLQRGGSIWFRSTVVVNGVRYVYRCFAQSLSPLVDNVFMQVEFDNVVKDVSLDRILV
eukprot:snap_masked-scaffold_9-processed-gene-8.49-mRNA-1 protein AED:1.00 eAED:1.00 QI:0/-1/0/0/-1/1/1/0/76